MQALLEFIRALGPTRLAAMAPRAANALLHAYSRIGRTLSAPRRSDLVGRIDAYRERLTRNVLAVQQLPLRPDHNAMTDR